MSSVPVSNRGLWKIGTIVETRVVTAETAPYPLIRTKGIVEKAGFFADTKVKMHNRQIERSKYPPIDISIASVKTRHSSVTYCTCARERELHRKLIEINKEPCPDRELSCGKGKRDSARGTEGAECAAQRDQKGGIGSRDRLHGAYGGSRSIQLRAADCAEGGEFMASKNDDFFGGMFDFNGDGKTDLGEQFIAYKIFEEVTKEEDSDSDDSDDIGFTPRRTSTYRPAAQPVKTMPLAQPLPEHISFTEYKSRRRAFVGEIFLSLLVAAVLCFTPGIIVWAAISSYDAKNSASGFVVTVFVIAGLVVAGIILYAAASSISGSYKNLMKAKEIYLKDAAVDELNQQKKAKKKRTIWICSILGAGLILLIVISSVNSSRLAADYSNAEMLISKGQYAEATAMLEPIKEKDYKDTSALLLLCKAHTQYDAGRSVDAYYTMQDAHFRYQTEEQTAEITAFKFTLKQEYDDYISRMAERNRQEYEDRITNGVPCVGMSESRINDTSLGRPSDKVRHTLKRRAADVALFFLPHCVTKSLLRDGKLNFLFQTP